MTQFEAIPTDTVCRLHLHAETGPNFLCATPYASGSSKIQPDVLQTSPDYLLKGYNPEGRMVYSTGAVTPKEKIAAQSASIFANKHVAYIHVRSARNNCYQARIDRD